MSTGREGYYCAGEGGVIGGGGVIGAAPRWGPAASFFTNGVHGLTGEGVQIERVPPDPALLAHQAAKESREAVERERKDRLDREERELAAKREHELAKLRLIQEAAKIDADERVALRNARGWCDESLISVAIGSAFVGALVAGLTAAAIP